MAVQFALWERQVFDHFYVNKPRASTDNFQQWPIFFSYQQAMLKGTTKLKVAIW